MRLVAILTPADAAIGAASGGKGCGAMAPPSVVAAAACSGTAGSRSAAATMGGGIAAAPPLRSLTQRPSFVAKGEGANGGGGGVAAGGGVAWASEEEGRRAVVYRSTPTAAMRFECDVDTVIDPSSATTPPPPPLSANPTPPLPSYGFPSTNSSSASTSVASRLMDTVILPEVQEATWDGVDTLFLFNVADPRDSAMGGVVGDVLLGATTAHASTAAGATQRQQHDDHLPTNGGATSPLPLPPPPSVLLSQYEASVAAGAAQDTHPFNYGPAGKPSNLFLGSTAAAPSNGTASPSTAIAKGLKGGGAQSSGAPSTIRPGSASAQRPGSANPLNASKSSLGGTAGGGGSSSSGGGAGAASTTGSVLVPLRAPTQPPAPTLATAVRSNGSAAIGIVSRLLVELLEECRRREVPGHYTTRLFVSAVAIEAVTSFGGGSVVGQRTTASKPSSSSGPRPPLSLGSGSGGTAALSREANVRPIGSSSSDPFPKRWVLRDALPGELLEETAVRLRPWLANGSPKSLPSASPHRLSSKHQEPPSPLAYTVMCRIGSTVNDGLWDSDPTPPTVHGHHSGESGEAPPRRGSSRPAESPTPQRRSSQTSANPLGSSPSTASPGGAGRPPPHRLIPLENSRTPKVPSIATGDAGGSSSPISLLLDASGTAAAKNPSASSPASVATAAVNGPPPPPFLALQGSRHARRLAVKNVNVVTVRCLADIDVIVETLLRIMNGNFIVKSDAAATVGPSAVTKNAGAAVGPTSIVAPKSPNGKTVPTAATVVALPPPQTSTSGAATATGAGGRSTLAPAVPPPPTDLMITITVNQYCDFAPRKVSYVRLLSVASHLIEGFDDVLLAMRQQRATLPPAVPASVTLQPMVRLLLAFASENGHRSDVSSRSGSVTGGSGGGHTGGTRVATQFSSRAVASKPLPRSTLIGFVGGGIADTPSVLTNLAIANASELRVVLDRAPEDVHAIHTDLANARRDLRSEARQLRHDLALMRQELLSLRRELADKHMLVFGSASLGGQLLDAMEAAAMEVDPSKYAMASDDAGGTKGAAPHGAEDAGGLLDLVGNGESCGDSSSELSGEEDGIGSANGDGNDPSGSFRAFGPLAAAAVGGEPLPRNGGGGATPPSAVIPPITDATMMDMSAVMGASTNQSDSHLDTGRSGAAARGVRDMDEEELDLVHEELLQQLQSQLDDRCTLNHINAQRDKNSLDDAQAKWKHASNRAMCLRADVGRLTKDLEHRQVHAERNLNAVRAQNVANITALDKTLTAALQQAKAAASSQNATNSFGLASNFVTPFSFYGTDSASSNDHHHMSAPSTGGGGGGGEGHHLHRSHSLAMMRTHRSFALAKGAGSSSSSSASQHHSVLNIAAALKAADEAFQRDALIRRRAFEVQREQSRVALAATRGCVEAEQKRLETAASNAASVLPGYRDVLASLYDVSVAHWQALHAYRVRYGGGSEGDERPSRSTAAAKKMTAQPISPFRDYLYLDDSARDDRIRRRGFCRATDDPAIEGTETTLLGRHVRGPDGDDEEEEHRLGGVDNRSNDTSNCATFEASPTHKEAASNDRRPISTFGSGGGGGLMGRDAAFPATAASPCLRGSVELDALLRRRPRAITTLALPKAHKHVLHVLVKRVVDEPLRHDKVTAFGETMMLMNASSLTLQKRPGQSPRSRADGRAVVGAVDEGHHVAAASTIGTIVGPMGSFFLGHE